MCPNPSDPLRILFLGASYGTLLGMRMAAAGHRVTFACRAAEAALINDHKLWLRVPSKERAGTVDIGPAQCRVPPDARVPDEVDPQAYDLACLAMQEPQYSAEGVRGLVGRIAAARIPCLSIMNMPLPPWLERIAPLDEPAKQAIFTEADLWRNMDPALLTMASADPQAMRVDADDMLLTVVTLPSNFKVAPFAQARHQLMLEKLAKDIDDSHFELGGASCRAAVRLRPHASRFVPLAKWPMLLTGNFRCLTDGASVSIREAVCSNEAESRELYDWVVQLCRALGAEQATMVPFEAYRSAAEALTLPSSLARGLDAGATAVERVDILIQTLAGRQALRHPLLDDIVTEVTARLEGNRRPCAT